MFFVLLLVNVVGFFPRVREFWGEYSTIHFQPARFLLLVLFLLFLVEIAYGGTCFSC